jgi:hypothetical protein
MRNENIEYGGNPSNLEIRFENNTFGAHKPKGRRNHNKKLAQSSDFSKISKILKNSYHNKYPELKRNITNLEKQGDVLFPI